MSAVDIGRVAGRIVETDAAAAAEAQRRSTPRPSRRAASAGSRIWRASSPRSAATRRRGSRPAKAIVVMGADHGVAAEGVSAYPQEVTGADAARTSRAAARRSTCWRARRARASCVVDMGVAAPAAAARPASARGASAPGTRNFARGPAMTPRAGAGGARRRRRARRRARARRRRRCSASARWASATRPRRARSPRVFTGAAARGGHRAAAPASTTPTLRAQGRRRRARRSRCNRPTPRRRSTRSPRSAASRSPALAGVVLGAAAARVPVVVDGFIASAAALVAVALAPRAAGYLIASHRSVEAGHRAVLAALGAEPLLDLGPAPRRGHRRAARDAAGRRRARASPPRWRRSSPPASAAADHHAQHRAPSPAAGSTTRRSSTRAAPASRVRILGPALVGVARHLTLEPRGSAGDDDGDLVATEPGIVRHPARRQARDAGVVRLRRSP